MSRATPDDQLKFLLSCVKHSNNGKIDFAEVANDCQIVSKGAAAKRYERLMKSNGIHLHSAPSERASQPAPVSKRKSDGAILKAAAAKRRKIEEDDAGSEKRHQSSYCARPKFEPVHDMVVKPEPALHSAVKMIPRNGYSPVAFQNTIIPPAPQYLHSQMSLSMSQPMPNYTVSSEVPRFFSSSARMQEKIPRQIAVQPTFQQLPTSCPETIQSTNGESTRGEQPAVFEVDEETNVLFNEFCNSEIFSHPDYQTAKPANVPADELLSIPTLTYMDEPTSENLIHSGSSSDQLDGFGPQNSIVIVD